MKNFLLKEIMERFGIKQGYENSFDVVNPATGEKIAALPNNDKGEVSKAIDKAYSAQQEWQNLSAKEKSIILRKWFDLFNENADFLAEIITLECGKPLAEAKGEVAYSASFIEWYAEKAKRIGGKIIDSPYHDTQIQVTYEPVGVVAAVTPWNFPLAMIARKVAPAFAAGCGVVVKPSELTPLSAFAAKILAEKAGIPEHLLQIVCNVDAKEIGQELTSNTKVKKLTFTGSTKVGKLLMAQSAHNVKKVSLELGGNAPFIVFDSTDVATAVKGLMVTKFIRNAGQVCIAANRIFVQEGIKDEFIRALKEAVSKVKVGNGFDEGVTLGPLINKQAVEKVKKHIADAVEKGAKIITGGKPHKLGQTFFEPTIIDKMSDDMLSNCEEIFGPVACLYSFKTEEEVIERSNNTPYGLASYFFSNDVKQINRARKALQSGMIGINTGILSTESAPFGGIKESGLGREGSDDGIYEFLEAKYCMESFV